MKSMVVSAKLDRKFWWYSRKLRSPEVPAEPRSIRPVEKLAKSYSGNLSGGIPELLPKVCPGYFRRAGNFGCEAGSSAPRTNPGKYG